VSERFSDLRLNTGRGGTEENFWPSFTDIMTVIVMIFMMVMLVLLLKNMDLVQRLQTTLKSERAATQQVKTTSSLNRDLQMQLERTQAQLDMLRMQLMDMGEERDRLREQLAQNRSALEQEQAARQQEHQRLVQEQTTSAALNTRLNEAATQLASLQSERRKQNERITALEQEKQQSTNRLADLQGEFSNLKVKYDKLVRPARTSRGKYVVKVRILRRDGKLLRSIQGPNQQQATDVDEAALKQMLDTLHNQHPDDMYVRIIFPDDSGLSYSEAWKMTESLLQKYDYYYRAKPVPNRPVNRPSGNPTP